MFQWNLHNIVSADFKCLSLDRRSSFDDDDNAKGTIRRVGTLY